MTLTRKIGSRLLTSSLGKRVLSSQPLSDDGKLLSAWVRDNESPSLLEQSFETLSVSKLDAGQDIVHVQLNRPKKYNAMTALMFNELLAVYGQIDKEADTRAVLLSGAGKHFCTGMDLSVFVQLNAICAREKCPSRRSEAARKVIKQFQKVISLPEACAVPVVAAVDGYCIGGAVDMVTACDIRLATTNASFSVKEIDLAIVADIGTLQRLPSIVGDQRARELSYTGRSFSGKEAKEYGLCLETYETTEAMMAAAKDLVVDISSKSPVTIRGVKKTLNYNKDHDTTDSLDQVADWNAAHIFSADLDIATASMIAKEAPKYPKV